MILNILTGIIGGGITAAIADNPYSFHRGKLALVWFLIFGGMCFSMSIIIFSVITWPIYTKNGYYTMETHTTQIHSLKNTSEINGNFTLGCGSINQKEYYYTYISEGKNRYKRFKIPSDNCVLVEDENENPYYSYEIKRYDKDSIWILMIDRNDKHNQEIHIPKGTILQKYSVY